MENFVSVVSEKMQAKLFDEMHAGGAGGYGAWVLGSYQREHAQMAHRSTCWPLTPCWWIKVCRG
jgi:hypothetical protein